MCQNRTSWDEIQFCFSLKTSWSTCHVANKCYCELLKYQLLHQDLTRSITLQSVNHEALPNIIFFEIYDIVNNFCCIQNIGHCNFLGLHFCYWMLHIFNCCQRFILFRFTMAIICINPTWPY